LAIALAPRRDRPEPDAAETPASGLDDAGIEDRPVKTDHPDEMQQARAL
jgi:hypothetical protein